MVAPKHKGEVTLTNGGQSLDLRYKARNIMLLTEITGKSPLEFFQKYGDKSDSDGTRQAVRVSSPAFILPLLAAGCAHHKQYRKQSVDTLIDNLESLLDHESEIGIAEGRTPLETYAMLGAQLMVPFGCALQGITEVNGEPLAKLMASVKEKMDAARSASAGEG